MVEKKDVSGGDSKGLFRRLTFLALPIMAGNFLQTLYNLADTWFLGKIDTVSLSAPSVSFPIMFFLIIFAMGFTMAGTTLISQSKGKGDQEKVAFYTAQTTTYALILSVFLSILGNLLAAPLLSLLKTPPEVAAKAVIYMRIVITGLPLMFLTLVQQAVFQGIGNTIPPLLIQALSVGVNLILDPLLIFGWGPFPAMGVAGAAWATVIARSLAAGTAVFLLVRGRQGVRLQLKYMRPQRQALGLFLKIGLPASVGQGLTALGFSVLQGIINGFGTPAIAAFGVGNRLIGLFNMPAMGLGQATAVMVGHALGGGRLDQARRVTRLALTSVSVFLVITMSLTFFWGNAFTRFFVDDPQVIALGADLFRIISASVVLFGLFTVLGGVFQGGGDTKPYLVLNILRLWGVRLPLAWALGYPLGMGPSGVWWGMFCSNLLVFCAAAILYRTGRWSRALDPGKI